MQLFAEKFSEKILKYKGPQTSECHKSKNRPAKKVDSGKNLTQRPFKDVIKPHLLTPSALES
jgi:hypothetical protein